MRNRRRVLLVDNGSLEPASTLQLRRLAAELESRVGLRVDPVSLAHSTRIPVAALGGRPAELFEAGLDRGIVEGASEFVIVPLFVGPSHAIERHVPAVVAERTTVHPGVRAVVTPPLFAAGDTRLAEILADHVRAQLGDDVGGRWRVAVVDHGSPARTVTEARDAVTAQVSAMLGGAVSEVAASSMERRPGPEYAFNEPLLENLLAREGWQSGPLVIALLFIGPGKHAGTEGDVARIVARVRGVGGEVRFTPVMGAHPRLMEILVGRVGGALSQLSARARAPLSLASP